MSLVNVRCYLYAAARDCAQKFSKVRALSALVAEIEALERELKAYADYAKTDIYEVSLRHFSP